MEALTIQIMVKSARLVPRLDPLQPTAAVMAINWTGRRPEHVRPIENGREQHPTAKVSVYTYSSVNFVSFNSTGMPHSCRLCMVTKIFLYGVSRDMNYNLSACSCIVRNEVMHMHRSLS